MGLEYKYGTIPFDTKTRDPNLRLDRFRAFLGEQLKRGLIGLSITNPYKELALETGLVESKDEVTLKIGAVNTLVSKGDHWEGHNTDWIGATACLKEAEAHITGGSALILGAGGMARAATVGLAEAGIERLTVANRSLKRSEDLARTMRDHYPLVTTSTLFLGTHGIGERLAEAAQAAHVIFNATDLGKAGDPATEGINPLAGVLFHAGQVVADAVYTPNDTPLLCAAGVRPGVTPVSGIDILLAQAVPQIELFTGHTDVPFDIMQHALMNERLRRQEAQA
jgi:shikimate dehydrogenase